MSTPPKKRHPGSVFHDFENWVAEPIVFLASAIRVVPKSSSVVPKKDTSIAGLRMFVAFLVFAKAPAM